MNYKQNSYEKTEMYKEVPLHFSMVISTFPNFPVENLESTLRANNANCIIWVKSFLEYPHTPVFFVSLSEHSFNRKFTNKLKVFNEARF